MLTGEVMTARKKYRLPINHLTEIYGAYEDIYRNMRSTADSEKVLIVNIPRDLCHI
jgi:hypothetical protein